MRARPLTVDPCRNVGTAPAGSGVRQAAVVLAVKDLARAKSRLAGVLGAGERERLVLAMFADTISAVRQAGTVGPILVVTPDARVARVATRAGALVVAEPTEPAETAAPEESLNTAYSRAATLADGSATLVVALQADLPALRPDELDAAIAAAPHGRSVVVDHTGTGTTALIARGRSVALDPSFGPGSARRHLDSGAYALAAAAWPGLRTDVDTLDDVRRVIDLGVGQHTRRVIERLGRTGRSRGPDRVDS